MKCVACGKNKWKSHFNVLLKCSSCNFVRAKDRFFKVSTKKLYAQSYFQGIEYTDYKNEVLALEKNFKDRISRIRKIKKSGKLLEIGCAYGYFLRLAKKYYKVTGVDIDSKVTNIARKNTKSKILTGDFGKINIKSKFDIICMFDVIEHLKEPDKYIKGAYQLLNKGGIIIIETGDIEALLPRVQKTRWRLITPPFHLQYFSHATITKLLEKNNFNVIKKTNSISFHRTIRQTLYRLGVTDSNNIINSIGNLILPTYTFDLMFVIAKK